MTESEAERVALHRPSFNNGDLALGGIVVSFPWPLPQCTGTRSQPRRGLVYTAQS